MLTHGPEFRASGATITYKSYDGENLTWWNLLKAVDVDFTFEKDAGWYGIYNRRDDEILINLSAFGGDMDKHGLSDQDDFDREQDIMETIMHEGGHAAALGKEYADLEDELFNWAANRVQELMEGSDKKVQQIRPLLTRLLDYLINEYIAAIAEGTYSKNKSSAMQNAIDQMIGANANDLNELIFFFDMELDERPDEETMGHAIMAKLFGMPNGWETTEYLIPLFDKYINNMGQIIFQAYQEGVSYRDKEAFEELTGETASPRTRGTMLNPQYVRESEGRASQESWMDRLRGN